MVVVKFVQNVKGPIHARVWSGLSVTSRQDEGSTSTPKHVVTPVESIM